MNIGIFTDTYYPEINGVANSAYQLKRELEQRGHNVYVFTVSNPEVTEPEANVFRMKSIPFALLKERRVGCSISAIWYRVIKGLKLDIIHSQTEFTVGCIGRRAAKRFGIPLIHTYHTIYEDYTHYLKIPGNQKLKGAIRSLSRVCCDHADVVVVPTVKVRNLLLDYGVEKDIVVQPTGIDLRKFQNVDKQQVNQLKDKFGLCALEHVLVSVGRLSKEKGLEEVIEHIAEIKKSDKRVKLIIVGDGPEKRKLKQLAQDYQISESVIFTGAVPWQEIQNYYALGDVFVSASTSETQGLSYIEALAAGKPILVKEDDCLIGVLDFGHNGYSYISQREFVTYYQKLFEDEAYISMKNSALNAADRISSTRFGEGMERIYISAMEKEKEVQAYENNHAVAG